MKKLILLVLLLALGFYVGWPAWSGYQIWDGLKRSDAPLLERKIDFPAVRETLRPAVAAEVDRSLASAGGSALQKQLAPELVELALQTVVTPQNIVAVFAGGPDALSSVTDIVGKKVGGLGGLLPSGGGAAGGGSPLPGGLKIPGLGQLGKAFGGDDKAAKPAKPATPKRAEKPVSYGFSNIKSFAFAGPLAFEVGIARDPNAKAADATARMGFKDLDWKLTGLTLHRR